MREGGFIQKCFLSIRSEWTPVNLFFKARMEDCDIYFWWKCSEELIQISFCSYLWKLIGPTRERKPEKEDTGIFSPQWIFRSTKYLIQTALRLQNLENIKFSLVPEFQSMNIFLIIFFFFIVFGGKLLNSTNNIYFFPIRLHES